VLEDASYPAALARLRAEMRGLPDLMHSIALLEQVVEGKTPVDRAAWPD
jgi:hypothetical protein